MQDYEKLGVFYLGREYDLSAKKITENLLLYDAKDLVTHAVCVGMTGSGKTGLCLVLLEEAAIDHIPAILIDPKGDLANLLLTFPELRPEDFAPWVNPEDAAKKGLSVEEFARQQAELWRKGLADWGQTPERIQRFRESVDLVVYTPGSTAGIPLSVLKSFEAPQPAVLEDEELLRERINTTVTSLLGLLGIQADPLQSREHILLSNLLDHAWRQGRDVDLAGLIQMIQQPPMTKIGVLDLESFYPSKERFSLMMALNNMLAAPGFNTWLEGEPLDIQRMLYAPSGKPRLAIVSIAHLNDAERMFMVSLLLNQVLGWMRQQSGTNSLRAILYMDEIFGYFPPTANPPSKQPLLTLLKQARAFGLGVMLATQNPVDLDYKGLSNAGTWFIGRLQTDRDKQRVLDGLEGAAVTAREGFSRQKMEQVLAGLTNRVFLMNNAKEDQPVVFHTRWALSYLRGPLTRAQIKTLMDPVRASLAPAAPRKPSPGVAQVSAAVASAQRPALAPDIPQYFLPLSREAPRGQRLLYRPMVYGAARLGFADAKAKVDFTQEVSFATPITDEPIPVVWENAQALRLSPSKLEKAPAEGAQFAELPAAGGKAKNYPLWQKDFAAWLYATQKVELYLSPSSGLVSKPGESEGDFRARLQLRSRETRDDRVEQLRKKYAPKVAALQERIRRAQEALAREKAQADQQKMQTAISVGSTLLGALVGRKTLGVTGVGRASTAARGASRMLKESQDVGRAQENLALLQRQLDELNAEIEAQVAELQAQADPLKEELSTLVLKPKKTDIAVQLCALVWAPYWQDAQGSLTPAWE